MNIHDLQNSYNILRHTEYFQRGCEQKIKRRRMGAESGSAKQES
jgi:hypothetical protein